MSILEPSSYRKELIYMGGVIFALFLLSACDTVANEPMPTSEPTATFPAVTRVPKTPTSPTLPVSVPTVARTVTPTSIMPLPTGSRPVSEALFVILADDQSRFLAAYEGQTYFQVLYQLPPEVGKVQITSYPIRFPTISNDGKLAVVVEDKAAGHSDIYLVDGTTHTAKPILTWAGPQFGATISPDGKRVAFLSSEGECLDQTEYAARYWCPDKHLYAMKVDGSDIKRLTTKVANRCSLSWSLTNVQLVYQEGCDPADLSQVYLLTLLGNGASKVVQVTQDGRGPSWSSDGRWLHWESVGNLQHVGLLNAYGDIVSRFDLGKILAASDVVWSPNSKQMAQAVDIGGEARIQVWDINSSGAQKHDKEIFTSGVSLRDRLKWLFDGKRFAFSGYGLDSSGRMANKESWFVMDTDGTHLVEFKVP